MFNWKSTAMLAAVGAISAISYGQSNAPYTYTQLSDYDQSTHTYLGYVVTVTGDGSVLRQAQQGNTTGYAITDSNGVTTFFTYSASGEYITSMSNRKIVVGDGPKGAWYRYPGETEKYYQPGTGTTLWGASNWGGCGFRGQQCFVSHDSGSTFSRFPGSSETMAYGLSNNGLFCGAYFSDTTHAFYHDTDWHSFDYPGSMSTVAYGINKNGDMVGTYDTGAMTGETGGGWVSLSGVLYRVQPQTPLNTITYFGNKYNLQDYRVDVNSINDSGQIVGSIVQHYKAQSGSRTLLFVYSFIGNKS